MTIDHCWPPCSSPADDGHRQLSGQDDACTASGGGPAALWHGCDLVSTLYRHQTHTDRQTDRRADKQTDRQADRQADRKPQKAGKIRFSDPTKFKDLKNFFIFKKNIKN